MVRAKSRNLLYAAVATACMICVTAVAIVAFGIRGNDPNSTLTVAELQEKYTVGETIEIPNGTIESGGNTYSVMPIVYTPAGVAYKTNKLTVQSMGQYKVEYKAVVSGKAISHFRYFEVDDKLFYVGSPMSSAFYGTDASQYKTEQKGINLSLQRGDVFYLNQVIDLNAYGKSDPLVKLFTTPTKAPTNGIAYRDVRKLKITISDVHDFGNAVTISLSNWDRWAGPSTSEQRAWAYRQMYALASATGQVPTGVSNKVYKNELGASFMYSMYGTYDGSDTTVGTEYLTVSADIDAKKFYVNNVLIAQLDEQYMEFPWEGFKTGEVKISISGADYFSNSFDMLITDIAGLDLSRERFSDTDEPKIDVDFGYVDERDLPVAVVNKAYPLFTAAALDGYSGECTVKCRVYNGMNPDYKFEYDIVDNAFIPDRAGVYYIEYSATDYSGNRARIVKELTCVDSVSEIRIETAAQQNGVAGIEVPIGEITDITGGSGGYVTDIAVLDGQGKETETDGKTFLPKKADTYKVVYTVKDYIGVVRTKEVSVSVAPNDKPVFDAQPILPKYLLEGFRYELPVPTAYDYGKGEYTDVTLTVSDGVGENRKIEDGATTFTPNKDGFAEIVYTAGESQIKKSIPVLRVKNETGEIDMAKYFVTEHCAAVAHDDYVALSADSSVNAKADFANPLSAYGFSADLFVDSEDNDFSAINLYLVDSVKQDRKIKITFTKGASQTAKSKMYINDEEVPSQTTVFNFYGNVLSLRYDNATQTVSTADGLSVKVTSDSDGNAFHGFDGGKLYFEIELTGCNGGTVCVQDICGQAINNTLFDFVKPKLFAPQTFKGYFDIGDEVTIEKAIAADVLTPQTTATITVTDSQGNAVTSIEGTVLNQAKLGVYSIRITQTGTYAIVYNLSDASGNKATFSYAIHVRDLEKPIITIDGEVPETAFKNDSIRLPAATARDNIDGEVTVYCMIREPVDYRIVQIDFSQPYRFTEIGMYELRYFAVDSSGNVSSVVYAIEVK